MDELKWLSLHPEKAERYSGKWVAITDKGVIASADSALEVELLLKKKNVALDKVMVMKLPRKDEELSIL